MHGGGFGKPARHACLDEKVRVILRHFRREIHTNQSSFSLESNVTSYNIKAEINECEGIFRGNLTRKIHSE